MTETEWLSATEPYGMIQTARRRASERKQRLFAVACCRRISHLLIHKDMQAAVETAELYADGLVSKAVCEGAYAAVDSLRGLIEDTYDEEDLLPYSPVATEDGDSLGVALHATDAARMAAQFEPTESGNTGYYPGSYFPVAQAVSQYTSEYIFEDKPDPVEFAFQCLLLRDIFGNPFRPVAIDLSWRTTTVVALAEGIYQDRAFDRMPILADALMDAGCEDEAILEHCRSEGPHVRGCWVVDLILGKE
jgi:hypothetical protein